MRPGDWMCPSCNNHNYADKIRCNRCKIPKLDAAWGVRSEYARSTYVRSEYSEYVGSWYVRGAILRAWGHGKRKRSAYAATCGASGV